MTNGWEESAAAWIADMGEKGDFGRRFVLDPIMLERARSRAPKTVLDVGCGEGRFSRALKSRDRKVVGLDPTAGLLAQARSADPEGAYVKAEAAAIPFKDRSFDLVVSYLSLIDIPEIAPAIAEMTRVLKPGGTMLIANLNCFSTAGADLGWIKDGAGNRLHYAMDHYLEERAMWVEYRGIRILNHHRPLSAYMDALLRMGLRLIYFAEPHPTLDAPANKADSYRRVPWFLVMEWAKE